MLLQLNIKNFALIEELSISFEKGFNILTGETGAGKSILIDAINYVLGGKFNKDLIRTGKDKTFVEAIFTLENEKTKEELINKGIEYEDYIIISRETFQSGKSITKINGRTILLSALKSITETLLDIHGQHENQNLLNTSKHLMYLDYFGEASIKKELEEYRKCYNDLKKIEKKILELSGNDGEREKLIDFLKFQIDEINNAKLKIEEEEELNEKFNILSNSEKISKVLSLSYEVLYNGEESTPSLLDSISYILKDLRTVENHMEKIESITTSLQEVYYIIQQITQDVRSIKEDIYYDEDELNFINSRLFQLAALKKKYAPDIKGIIEYKDKIEKQYEDLLHSSEIIEKLNNNKKVILKSLKLKALDINKIRVNVAKTLEKNIKEELNYIGMGKSSFKIQVNFNEVDFNENGMDTVQFLIATNPGEPLKPLEKVVSGGELSRVMLALKTVFVDKDKIPSVIFDEIDTGISGRIAQSVAEKMYVISNKHQVFCVTHLPQIAAMSDYHYLISKKICKSKTYTLVKQLSIEEKEKEIGRMISGTEMTELTLKNAQEMVKMAEHKKHELIS
ncbi:DNA repair protein RecN [Clostridium rectalis]|uniref:DNA repair protein RecN n=1 Tax=Clostridium rectalis TaxID=2040295 RepID=UPI000F63AA59|nr:DNA repair protein RecN [Clostridium rectalis]